MKRESGRRHGSLTDNEYFVLKALSSSPLYGYRVIKEVETRTLGEVRLSMASLYDALHRLQTAGLVEQVGDEIVDGRVRRMYEITGYGEEAIAGKERAINRMQAAHEGFAGRPGGEGFLT